MANEIEPPAQCFSHPQHEIQMWGFCQRCLNAIVMETHPGILPIARVQQASVSREAIAVNLDVLHSSAEHEEFVVARR